MPNRHANFCLTAAVLLLGLLALTPVAGQDTENVDPSSLSRELDALAGEIENDAGRSGEAEALRDRLLEVVDRADACSEEAMTRSRALARLHQSLPDTDAGGPTQRELEERIQRRQGEAVECSFLSERGGRLLEQLDEARRSVAISRIREREPALWSTVPDGSLLTAATPRPDIPGSVAMLLGLALLIRLRKRPGLLRISAGTILLSTAALAAWNGVFDINAGLNTESPRGPELAAAMLLGLALLLYSLATLAAPPRRTGDKLLLALTLLLAVGALAGFMRVYVFGARALVLSLALVGAYLALKQLGQWLFERLGSEQHQPGHWLRQRLSVSPGERVPGLIWLRMLYELCLAGGAVLLLLQAWRLTDAGLPELRHWFLDGFSVGDLRIVPLRIFGGILLFALILLASRRFNGWIADRLSKGSDTPQPTLEVTTTLLSYLGLILGAAIALTFAGFNLTNLAIIAGALSVGIGFGLQNVVNNFVSGLILLFERPIKRGDWVQVGETHGLVQRIRVRSTEIRTFDRSEVIVPNADLISNQVTNWTLHDGTGRIILKVGVAYGSDTALVMSLLRDIIRGHPEVITDGTSPEPRILFMAFGESSLDFEIRAFIRDITMKWDVTSELNLQIDQAFRDHGVTIPFPQRDVHLFPNAAPSDEGSE